MAELVGIIYYVVRLVDFYIERRNKRPPPKRDKRKRITRQVIRKRIRNNRNKQIALIK